MLELRLEIVNAEELTGKFTALENRIDELPRRAMPDELTAWQTEDMKRKYPNIDIDTLASTTDIWPHSRLELEGGRPRTRTYT